MLNNNDLVREGNLSFGDEPHYLRAPIIIEGEVFWGVKWIPNINCTLIMDSYESEDKLKSWSQSRFTILRESFLQKEK